MKNEFTAIIEQDGEWHIAYCPRTKHGRIWPRP